MAEEIKIVGKSFWEIKKVPDMENLARDIKILSGKYTEGDLNITYQTYVNFNNDDSVEINIDKIIEGECSHIFTKTITPIERNNDLFLTYSSKVWYNGFKFTNSESKHINDRFNFLFSDEVINALIDSLRLNTPEFIGNYSTKFEDVTDNLVKILSNTCESHKAERIIHTKTTSEILRDCEFMLMPSMPLDGRLIGAINEIADKDFIIIEDVRETDVDLLVRTTEVSQKDKVDCCYKAMGADGKIHKILVPMVYTITEKENKIDDRRN